MKLLNILSEVEFRTYTAMVQVLYKDGTDSNKAAEMIRALPGVTTVTVASKQGENKETLKIKIISQKESLEAFNALKDNAVNKYPNIIDIKIGEQTLEEK